jgi:hypothetical protein
MKRGDHIYVDLELHKQHGIYCGDNLVIYWINDDSSRGMVQQSLLADFSSGRTVKKRSYCHRCSSVVHVIERAERRLKEDKLKYKFSDSKAFAMYCKTGLKIGDHIRVDHGLYYHHGVYYGNDKVAHYAGGGRIRITSLRAFAGRRKIHTVKHKKACCTRTIIKKVDRRLGEKKYNLVFNNCEHFATWCVTGRHRSSQIDNPMRSATKIVVYLTDIKPD